MMGMGVTGEVDHCVAIVWSQPGPSTPWLYMASRGGDTRHRRDRRQDCWEQTFANIQSMFSEKRNSEQYLERVTLYACPVKLF